jgi:hypothetical protein
MSNIHAFIEGALAMSYVVAATYFLRCWAATTDRLFACFFAFFATMAATRIALTLLAIPDETLTWFYLARLAAYGMIIWGIVAKNVGRPPRSIPGPRG